MVVRSRAMEGVVMRPDPAFWRGKRVLLTGHTGFKGAWLAIWLHRLGARVVGAALAPAAGPSLFELAQVSELLQHHQCDVRDPLALAALVRHARPEIVLHLAAQALVRTGYREPAQTFSTNVMGTANLLDAVRGQAGVRVVVVVTTDKVYQDQASCYPHREDDALGGHDPYSASKAAAELVVACYRDSYLRDNGVAVASARAGNVIGGGDWAQERLLPDAFRAWSRDQTLEVRRPAAVRPWQHVLEPLAGYLRLAEKLWQDPRLAGAYNFGPDTAEVITVGELVQLARNAFGRGHSAYGTGASGPHETGTLTLEVARARQVLGLRPCWPVQQAVSRTMAWYRHYGNGAPARGLCLADITDNAPGNGVHAQPAPALRVPPARAAVPATANLGAA